MKVITRDLFNRRGEEQEGQNPSLYELGTLWQMRDSYTHPVLRWKHISRSAMKWAYGGIIGRRQFHSIGPSFGKNQKIPLSREKRRRTRNRWMCLGRSFNEELSKWLNRLYGLGCAGRSGCLVVMYRWPKMSFTQGCAYFGLLGMIRRACLGLLWNGFLGRN